MTWRRQKGPKNLCNVSLPKIPFFSRIFVAFITIFGMCIQFQGEFFMHSPKRAVPEWANILTFRPKDPTRLIFTSDGFGVRVANGVIRAKWPSENQKSESWAHGVKSIMESESKHLRRIRTFPLTNFVLPTPLITLSLKFHLWSSENQIVGVGSRSRWINQSQCTFPHSVIVSKSFCFCSWLRQSGFH